MGIDLDRFRWRILVLLPLAAEGIFAALGCFLSLWLCYLSLVTYLLAITIHDVRRSEIEDRKRMERIFGGLINV